MVDWPEDRPRWGTYSVKGHLDLERLIPDLLLYDVLVFPTPDSDAEYQRWEENGWGPDLLAYRFTQLGDHAVACPWNQQLRSEWNHMWDALSGQYGKDPQAAFTTTAAILAAQSPYYLMGAEDDRAGQVLVDQPRLHPTFGKYDGLARARKEDLELVATFQDAREAAMLTGVGNRKLGTRKGDSVPEYPGIRLRLRLEVPVDDDQEKFLHRALDLVENDDFQQARRRLWSWERNLKADVGADELAAGLDALVADYNRVVRGGKKATFTRWVFLVLPIVAGGALDVLTANAGGAGVAAGVGSSLFFEGLKAQFPRLEGKAERASYHPGSAVSGMLAIAGPATDPEGG
jgi:hypothetical protein